MLNKPAVIDTEKQVIIGRTIYFCLNIMNNIIIRKIRIDIQTRCNHFLQNL